MRLSKETLKILKYDCEFAPAKVAFLQLFDLQENGGYPPYIYYDVDKDDITVLKGTRELYRGLTRGR